MSDQEEQDSTAPEESTDSDTVQAALRGIPGLADVVGNQPVRKAPSAPGEESGESEPEPQLGTAKSKVEDSETVQQALRQLGLQ